MPNMRIWTSGSFVNDRPGESDCTAELVAGADGRTPASACSLVPPAPLDLRAEWMCDYGAGFLKHVLELPSSRVWIPISDRLPPPSKTSTHKTVL